VPGRVLEGKFPVVPGSTDVNDLMPISEYAGQLALSGFGAGNLLGGAGTGSARQFGAWHGTRAPEFRDFADAPEHIASGAGAQTEGHGIYVAGDREIGSLYHEPGVDLTYNGEHWETGRLANVDESDPMQLAMDEVHRNMGDFVKARNSLMSNASRHSSDPEYSDYFRNAHDWLLSNEERIGVTPIGGLLRVNVIPEEEEFMNWHKPFSQQEPGVQQGILKSGLLSKDRIDYMPLRDSYGNIYSYSIDPNGEQIYRQMVRDNWEKVTGNPLDHANFDFNSAEAAPVKQHVSKTLDDNGVVGNKYTDFPGNTLRPELKHKELFETAPNPELARAYLHTTGMDVNTAINESLGMMNRHIDSLKGEVSGGAEGISNLKNLIDWTSKEHAAGNFKVGDTGKWNYVVFNPKNVEIRTWDGRPIEPMPEGHDPFDVTRP
jgi:hypothetical protein